jgi:hypothetical protein
MNTPAEMGAAGSQGRRPSGAVPTLGSTERFTGGKARAFPRKRLVKVCTKRFREDVDLVPASDLKPAVRARAERDLVAL